MQHRNIASTQAEFAIKKLDALFVKNTPPESMKSLAEECATPTTININAVAAALFHLHRESVFSALVKHYNADAADNG